MPIITISKIKMRSGRKHDGYGIPQLDTAEFGWAIDAKELYIGNGSLSSGAPSVGNTRILTENDVLGATVDATLEYAYQEFNGVQTGPFNGVPYKRDISDVLDDFFYITAFGVKGDGSLDNTASIQRALNELLVTHASVENRVIVNFPPGEYVISDTITLPSHVTIKGAGIDKTIIRQLTNSKAIFTTDTNVAGNSTHVEIEGMTLQRSNNSSAIILNKCRDSKLSSLKFIGYPSDSANQKPLVSIVSDNLESGVVFDGCIFENAVIGVRTDAYITLYKWVNCAFKDLEYGIVLGDLTNVPNPYPPYYNIIDNNIFLNIQKQAIHILLGKHNKSNDNVFINVGNDGAGLADHSIIKFGEKNYTINDSFQRTEMLILNDGISDNIPYVTEIEGYYSGCFYNGMVTLPFATKTPVVITDPIDGSIVDKIHGFIRLPFVDDQRYKIEYVLKGNAYNGHREGVLHVFPDTASSIKIIDNVSIPDATLEDIEFSATLDTPLGIVYINVSSLVDGETYEISFDVCRK